MDIRNHEEFTTVLDSMATKHPAIEESFDFEDVVHSIANEGADPIALLLGFGIGLLAVAFFLWRYRKAQRQQRNVEELLRLAEANSPYSDNASHKEDSFVEIDLRTLHRMN